VPKAAAGFTLTELIVVLVVITLIAGLVAPTFIHQLEYARLTSGCRQIVSYMRYARSQAILRGVPYRLNMDDRGQRYWITVYDEEETEDLAEPFRPDSSNLGARDSLPEGVTIEELLIGDELAGPGAELEAPVSAEGYPVIEFRPDGTCDGARMLLKNNNEERLAIFLDAATGRAEIAEEAEE